MKEKYWFFSAVSCLLLAVAFLEEFSFMAFFLLIIWILRLFALKNKRILIQTSFLSLLFLGSLLFSIQANKTQLTGEEEQLLVYPETTSIKIDGDHLRLNGWVTKDSEIKEKIVIQYYLETEAEQKSWQENPPTEPMLLTGELEAITPHSNFYQFNYQTYLRRKNIHWQMTSKEIQHLHSITTDSLKTPPFYFMEKIRTKLIRYIDQYFSKNIGNYIKTLFLADKRDFSEETLANYRSLGVVHLFSISGFHITYLLGLLRRLFLRLQLSRERTDYFLLVLAPLYGFLAGFGVSVFRAVFQAVFILISKAFGQEINTLNAWSLTMLFAMFINPYQIYDLSFQLSYLLSGIFIIMGHQKWIRKLSLISYAALFALLSGVASIPILTYHFYEISWFTIFANLFFIPFFTYLLFPLLLFLLLFSFFLKDTNIFMFLNETISFGLQQLEKGLAMLNNTFDFTLITGRLPFLLIVFLCINIFYFLKKIENKSFPQKLTILNIFLCLFYHQLLPVGYVLMLDVGQGDCLLIKAPNSQKTTMIDTGGILEWRQKAAWQKQKEPFSLGKQVVVPSLKAFGVSEIDRLYITHADEDHMGEIETIGEELKIKEIASTKETLADENVFKQLSKLKDIEVTEITPPTTAHFPNKNSLILYPTNLNTQSKNDQSLVIYVKMGEDYWLFTGDIETDAEKEMVKKYPKLPTDYLKVPHHGSKTSSTEEFMKQTKPEYALISVGANNSYGHPDPEVLERLTENNVRTYTTAKDGAIIVKYFKIPFLNQWLVKQETVHKN